MEQQTKDLIKTIITNDLNSGRIKTVTEPTGRFYVTNDNKIKIPLTTAEETYATYKKLIIDTNYFNQTTSTNNFSRLPRVNIFVGKPDTGKTYKAMQTAKDYNVEYLFIMGNENLTLETLLQDFTVVDGKPVFKRSLALDLLSDTNDKECIIILDEFNTLLTGVTKTLQPLFDDTSTSFAFMGTVYHKNPNCKFILTMNDKDRGVNILPDAILSRSAVTYFDAVKCDTLASWLNMPVDKVSNIEKLYTLLELSSIFGARQIKIISLLQNVPAITNHFKGLLSLQPNVSDTILNKLDTIEFINAVSKVI